MHTQLHVALEIQDLQAGNLLINDGDFSAPSCSLMEVNNQKPAKKPMRQWAAWTRQEKENFFNALRQVGKNFEEITCQVQSKNRNQIFVSIIFGDLLWSRSKDSRSRSGQKDIDSIRNSGGRLCSPTHHQTDNAAMQPSLKFILQLFPIDEVTRQALKKDACSPHLELIISGRKRISSILEHLNRKWGNSSIASGEIMLLPYCDQQMGINQQRWTAKDITSTAADVYATVGSPAVFRLRYGWFSNVEPVMGIDQVPSPPHCDITMHSEDFQGGFDLDVPNGEKRNVELPIRDIPTGHISELPAGQEVSSGTRNILSAGDWADSLTNISIGDLLSEASKAAKSSCVDSSIRESIRYPQENLSCDSFDAAIAAHTSRTSTQASPTSMWNADDTCDEFSFQNAPAVKSKESSFSQFTEDSWQTTVSSSLFQSYFKELCYNWIFE